MIYPDRLAREWVDAWSRRDLDVLLGMYAQNIVLHSPFAKLFAREGTIVGKEQLRAYWTEVLRRTPVISIELVDVYSGHQAVTLHYRDGNRRNCMETMLFDEEDNIVLETACLDKLR